jgi:hypothetical protein
VVDCFSNISKAIGLNPSTAKDKHPTEEGAIQLKNGQNTDISLNRIQQSETRI